MLLNLLDMGHSWQKQGFGASEGGLVSYSVT